MACTVEDHRSTGAFEPAPALEDAIGRQRLNGDPLNWTRYRRGQRKGHYESFYQRANHPTRPLAFWIRYTIFSPHRRPEAAIGELWASYFDGETGNHVVAKEEHPLDQCEFATDALGARVGRAGLRPGRLHGTCASLPNVIGWDLGFTGSQRRLLLLPERMYSGPLPKAKSLVGLPGARYEGTLSVNGRDIDVSGWTGSQNHNWGSRHTDHYAFGQVAGFDNSPDSFLELASVRMKVGPVTSPMLSPLVLRHRGQEHAFVTPVQAWRAEAAFGYFEWTFAHENRRVRIEGRIGAPKESFVGLNYYNPPGGIKHCLNTKIASCELTVTDKLTRSRELLTSRHRACFEILTDDRSHGIRIRA